jgi:dihydroxy-acid dehydratase
MARRCGLDLPLSLFDEIARLVPVLANIRPSGEFLMEDFYYAGGLRALMAEIADLLELDCLTVNGKTLRENLKGARVVNHDVIRGREAPLSESGGTAILYGNLAPNGAVIKTVAADGRFSQHTGPAVVFHDYKDLDARINCEDLNVTENSVLVLRNAGPL